MKQQSGRKHKMNLPDGWDIVVATNKKEIEEIRPIWEKMQSSEPSPAIETDIDRYLSIIKSKEKTVQPYVIMITNKGNPEAMIIARIRMHKLPIKLGYKTLFHPQLKSLTVSYGGILGCHNNDINSLVIQMLTGILREKKVDMIYFNHMAKDSSFYQLSKKRLGFMSRCYFPEYEKHWKMTIPKSMEQFYKTLSQRHRANIKRYKRKLEKKYSDKLRIIIYSKQKDLETAIHDVVKISRSTYQYQLGHGFTDDFRTRCLLKTAAEKGWLRIHIMYINGEPCAFENWIKYRNKYIGHGIGFDPKWKKWRIGTVLFMNTLEHICNDPDTEEVDFGFGDAEYKRSYGDQQWEETSVYVFAPRLYPILVNFLYSTFSGISLGLNLILDKSGLKDKTKRLWRNRLTFKESVK